MGWVKQALVIAVVLYLAIAALVYLLQDQLIFLPRPLERPPAAPSPAWSIEEFQLSARDGVKLHGWLIKTQSDPAPLVIYFGGNAEEVSYLAQLADRYGGSAVLLVNYRGYGASEGKPSEKSLLSDALEIFEAVSRRSDIDKERIILHGRSLGTGVATFLARERPVRGVILTSAYDSIRSIAQQNYPLLPVSLLLKHPFDSLARAPHIKVPLLALAGNDDDIIPIGHSQRLFAAWGGPKQWRDFPAGHNNISELPGYWDTISAFVRSLH